MARNETVVLVHPACGVGTNAAECLVFCTLLGPEGPGTFSTFVWGVGANLGTDGTFGVTVVPVKASDLVVSSFWAVCGRYRPYFENYTVDASILKMHTMLILRGWQGLRVLLDLAGEAGVCHKLSGTLSWVSGYSCDINFLRADGGCLGIWSRRRTYKSAISLGELIIEP